jgi:cell division protein FtsN
MELTAQLPETELEEVVPVTVAESVVQSEENTEAIYEKLPFPAGEWYVQVAANTDLPAARKLQQTIAEDGLVSDVYNITVRGKIYYRVVVGPTSKKDAKSLLDVLKKKEYIKNVPFLRKGR